MRDNFMLRGCVLFVIGSLFAFVLNLLQAQRKVTLFPHLLNDFLSAQWWFPPCCGSAAVIVGLLLPYFDRLFCGKQKQLEWASVMRCVAVFIGINHACAKINFSSDLQLSLVLGAMSIGLWWLFDRSGSGFVISICLATVATFFTQLFIYNNIFRYTSTSRDVLVQTCLPCIFFSAGVTIGNIGRLLAISDINFKQHLD